MAQVSYPWGGVTTGDAGEAPYSDDQWSDIWSLMFSYNRARQGVLRTNKTGFSGLLAPTNPSALTIRVATGAAIVDGKLYTNSANVDNSIPNNTNWNMIVLRKDWAAQTVRIALKTGYASDAAALAGLTQSDGTTWEIPIATAQGDGAGGVAELYDRRQFINSGSGLGFADRVGGSSTNWLTYGTNVYQLGNLVMLMGTSRATTTAGSARFQATIDIPRRVDSKISFVASKRGYTDSVIGAVDQAMIGWIESSGYDQILIQVERVDGGSIVNGGYVDVQWMLIGEYEE